LRQQEKIEEEYERHVEEKLEEAQKSTEAQGATKQDVKAASGEGEKIGIESIRIELGTTEED